MRDHLFILLPTIVPPFQALRAVGHFLASTPENATITPRNPADGKGRRGPMSAPRDSRCRYKECYNCKNRLLESNTSASDYICALAIDGTIRVFECGGLRYYVPATKAQRREQHVRLAT
jgi:hypothetical protein